MGFNYEKFKRGDGGGHEWGTYSDLFMNLAVVFLLLYVVASVRTGTSAVQKHIEYQKMAAEAADLRQQIKVYSTLKQDYLEKGASQDEQQVYTELMDKLTLLQDEAKKEKDSLRQQAAENEKKEMALNKYQQLIRNIVNSNMIAQARIKRRDTIIEEKDDTIEAKTEEIQELEKSVEEKKRTIAQVERKIKAANQQLDRKAEELKEALDKNEITRKNYDQQMAKLKQTTQERLQELRAQNKEVTEQLSEVSGQLTQAASALQSAEKTIEEKDSENKNLQSELQGAASKFQAQIDQVKQQYDAERQKEREQFEAQLAKEKLSAAQKAAREAEFKEQAERKAQAMADKVAALNEKISDTEGQLQQAKALANARKQLASEIKRNFQKAGVKAEVDPNTGDVVLDFGDQYFDTGRSNLKSTMTQTLEKAMPVYSASLFDNKRVADKIKSVEIVGFASPTYKGKYIDPKSMKPEDRKAVQYNLDLSYQRARSIFNYVFDTDKMQFKYQKQLLPLVKVTGRSFLSEAKNERSIAGGASEKEFCEVYDCKKAQRVIIKFNLDN